MQYIIFVRTNRLDDLKTHSSVSPQHDPPCDFVAYSLQSLKIVQNKWKVFYLYHLLFV